MKNFILLSLLILIASCGKPKEAEIIGGAVTVEDFEVYEDEFYDRMTTAGIAIPTQELFFEVRKDMSGTILGSCSSRFNHSTLVFDRVVQINYYYWIRLPIADREELIFHELGHCVLNRAHNDTLDGSGVPVSIMNSTHLGQAKYLAQYSSYIQELFNVSAPLFAGITFDQNIYASTLGEPSMILPVSADESPARCGWKE